MNCLLSCFNCLSWLGLHDFLITHLAFFPPKPEDTLELPLLDQEKSPALFKQETHCFSSRNGNKTTAFLFRSLYKRKKGLVILFSHGNATAIRLMTGFFIAITLRLKVDVFAYEYNGYGRSSMASPSEEGLLFDIEAAYFYLINELSYSPTKIILYGQSLGSFPSIYLSSNPETPVQGLILHSPLASGLRIICPGLEITPDNDFFINLEMIGFVKCPIMLIHGEKDQVVHIDQAKKLVERAKGLNLNWWVDDCGHEDIVEKTGALFYSNIRGFLKLAKGYKHSTATAHEYAFAGKYNRFFRRFIEEKDVFYRKKEGRNYEN